MIYFWLYYGLANLVAFMVIVATVMTLVDEEDGVIWIYPLIHKILGMSQINLVGKIILYTVIHLFILPAIIIYFIMLSCVIVFVSIWITIAISCSKRR